MNTSSPTDLIITITKDASGHFQADRDPLEIPQECASGSSSNCRVIFDNETEVDVLIVPSPFSPRGYRVPKEKESPPISLRKGLTSGDVFTYSIEEDRGNKALYIEDDYATEEAGNESRELSARNPRMIIK